MTQPARALTRAAALVLAAAMAATTPASAQPPGGGRGAMMSQMMFEGITLTAAQQAKIDSIRAANRAQGGPGAGGAPMDSAARAERMARMQAERTAIRAVLTAEQQPVFDKNVQAMEERMRAMRAQRGGNPPR